MSSTRAGTGTEEEEMRAYHEGSETFSVDSLGLCHGHGTESSTVVRSLHDNDVLLVGRVTSKLDGSFNSFGSRVPVTSIIVRFCRQERVTLKERTRRRKCRGICEA
jgi:hypothetical protein